MLSLQNLPTLHWGDNEISLLVAEAYRLKYMFDDAPNHLQPRETWFFEWEISKKLLKNSQTVVYFFLTLTNAACGLR